MVDGKDPLRPMSSSVLPSWPPWRRRGLRVLLVLLVPVAAAGLLALAAVGALRSPPGAGRGEAHFPTALVESVLLVALVAAVLAGVAAVYALGPDHRRRRAAARQRGWILLLFPLLLIVAVRLLRGAPRHWLRSLLPPTPTNTVSSPQAGPLGTTSHPQPEWLPVLLLGGLLLAVVAGSLYGAWRQRRQLPPPSPRELAALLGEVLDEVAAETDPRRAVIAAWAGMERRFGVAGLARHPAETPLEYVARILLAQPAVGPEPVRQLADLFEQAKFSQHPIDVRMREQALATLRAIRQDLAEVAAAAAAGTARGVEGEAAWRGR